MHIYNSLYLRLSTFTTLTDLVGERIYPVDPTTNTQLPIVTYRITATNPQPTLSGTSTVTNYTVQIDVWTTAVLADLTAISTQVRAALDCYRGGQFQGVFMTDSKQTVEETGRHEQLHFLAGHGT